MGNSWHSPWPLWENYGFDLDVLAALEGLCMATFSVPWADAPARPAMVNLQHLPFRVVTREWVNTTYSSQVESTALRGMSCPPQICSLHHPSG